MVFAEATLHGGSIASETDLQGLPDTLPLSEQCGGPTRGTFVPLKTSWPATS